MLLDENGGAKGIRLWIADLVLAVSQELVRAGIRVERLHTRLDPIFAELSA